MKYLRLAHPLLFAIAPILLLYSHNIDLVTPAYLVRPIVAACLGEAIFFALVWVIVKSNVKAAIIASLWTVGFYSFGHVFQLMPSVQRNGLALDLYYPFLIVALIIIVALTALIVTTRRTLQIVTTYLTTVGILLVCFPLFTVTRYAIQTAGQKTETPANEMSSVIAEQKEKPDIYYLVLDGYARTDVLKEIYQSDNSELISFLQQAGFYIADQSTANYPQTFFSIASSLNSEYIDSTMSTPGAAADDRGALRTMIENSTTHSFLKGLGYQFVSFPSGWVGLSQHLPADLRLHEAATVSEFENMLIATTPLSRIFDRTIRTNQHRREVLFALDHLPDLASNPAPTFTYVHIMSPHPPFVFDANGGVPIMKGGLFAYDGSHYFKYYPDKALYRQQYRDQLAYVSEKVMATVKRLLAQSPQPPIIIIQSDHGPGSQLDWERPDQTNMKERLSILNAFYVPAAMKSELYSTITPVNTFRLLFNTVFGQSLERLPDRNYFNTWNRPWEFIDVSESIKK